MKKALTILCALALFAGDALAQRSIDLEVVEILEPSELRSTQSGTPWPGRVVLRNNGTDTIKFGDTLLWSTWITDISTNQVVAQFPNNATQGSAQISALTKGINPGDTIHFTFSLNMQLVVNQSRDIRVIFNAGLLNRANTISPDPVTNNNSKTLDIVWYNIEGWGVSVEEITFNDNLNVYPNPADDQMMVRLLAVNFNEVKIELYDLAGNKVFSETSANGFENNHYIVNTADLSEGLYILKVSNGDKVSTAKISVAH